MVEISSPGLSMLSKLETSMLSRVEVFMLSRVEVFMLSRVEASKGQLLRVVRPYFVAVQCQGLTPSPLLGDLLAYFLSLLT